MHICIGDDHPNTKDINTHVIPHIPADKWEDLGVELLDSDTVAAELSRIKADKQETSLRCKAMFEKWLLSHSATWNELIAALERVRLTSLAVNIKKILSSTTGTYVVNYRIYMHTYIHMYIHS